jgi:hypothetical protein
VIQRLDSEIGQVKSKLGIKNTTSATKNYMSTPGRNSNCGLTNPNVHDIEAKALFSKSYDNFSLPSEMPLNSDQQPFDTSLLGSETSETELR